MREAQVLGSDSDSDDSGPVYGGRSDDEGLSRCICCICSRATISSNAAHLRLASEINLAGAVTVLCNPLAGTDARYSGE